MTIQWNKPQQKQRLGTVNNKSLGAYPFTRNISLTNYTYCITTGWIGEYKIAENVKEILKENKRSRI